MFGTFCACVRAGFCDFLTGVISPKRLMTSMAAKKRRTLMLSPVSVEKSRFTTRFLYLLVFWLFASLVSSGQVHAVAICGVGLQLRNRTSRFRFCAVAAR